MKGTSVGEAWFNHKRMKPTPTCNLGLELTAYALQLDCVGQVWPLRPQPGFESQLAAYQLYFCSTSTSQVLHL